MARAFLERNWLTLHGVVVAFGLRRLRAGVARAATSAAIRRRRSPGWSMLALLPYVALPLYFMFGSRKLPRARPAAALPRIDRRALERRRRPRRSGRAGSPARWAWRNATAYERLRIHRDGTRGAARAARADRRRDARRSTSARSSSRATRLGARDRRGADAQAPSGRARARAARRLRRLARRPASTCARCARAGIEVVKFVPALKSAAARPANLRNHRKMLDRRRRALLVAAAATSPPNISRAIPARQAAWHDLSFDLRRRAREPGAAALRDRLDVRARMRAGRARAPPYAIAVDRRDEPPLAQLIPSGPDQADDTVQALLVSGAFMARRRILMVTPYFVPDATLLMALTLAARRGVAVDLVMPAALEPPPRRRRAQSAAARPRRGRRAHLGHAAHAAREGGRDRRRSSRSPARPTSTRAACSSTTS